MTTSDLQVAHIVSLTMKSKSDPTNTNASIQFYFTNVPMLKSGDFSAGLFYYPILTRIDGVGSDSGEIVPIPRQGSFTIKDGASSLGFERRLSDLFQRYAVIGATVEIFTALEPLTSTTLFESASSSWTTQVRDVQRQGDDLTFYIVERGLSNKVLTKIVDSTTHPDAPDASLGKYLPIVFGGTEQVKPVMVDGTAGAPVWGYATTLYDDFMVSGVDAVLAKNHTGAYSEVVSGGSVLTVSYLGGALANTGWALTNGPVAWKINPSDSTQNFIVRGIKVVMVGNNTAGTVRGQLKFQLVPALEAGGPDESRVLATATVEKSAYSTEYQAAGEFTISPLSLDRPVPLMGATVQDYFVICSSTNDDASAASVSNLGVNASGGNDGFWTKRTSTDGTFSVDGTNPDIDVEISFTTVCFTDDPTPSGDNLNALTGLGTATLEMTQLAAASGQPTPDLSKLDLVFEVNGLLDDAGGSVSGSGSSILRNPQHIIELLDYEWSGSAWTAAGNFDFSKFSTTHTAAFGGSGAYTRRISGFTTGRATVAELMQQVCRCSASRIVRTNTASTPLALYAWGTTETTQAVISDEDSRVVALRYFGVESCINRAVIRSQRKIANTDFSTAIAQGVGEILQTVYTYDRNTSGAFESLFGPGTDTYGVLELSDNDFPFLDGSASTYSDAMGNFYLRRFAEPHVYVEIEVPYYKYSGIDNMEVVEICTPELPAYFGTSANAKLPFYDGDEVDVMLGDYMKRFQRYRAQVEGRTIEFNIGGFPILKLNCRLLLTDSDPT